MTKFPISVEIPVAWGDMDAFGHVNNVKYMRYFESARVKYFDELMVGEGTKSPIQPVLASITANFKFPVVYPDTITVKMGVGKIGNTSLQMECEMYNQAGKLVLDGYCTIVMFNFKTGQPAAVPEEIRAFIEKIEGSVMSGE